MSSHPATVRSTDMFDVAVIGGGVLGTAVAARLSATSATVVLLEAESDVCEGASKGNAGVAVSYYGPPGTVETALINESCPRWEDICTRLSVPYRRLGAVMIALDDEQAATLETTLGELTATGVRGRLLSPREVRETEPLVTESCVGGLLMPDEGVIDPMALTSAFANLAAVNRVSIRLSSPVTRIDRTDSGVLSLHTPTGTVRARYVVNAGGVGAGAVSRMAGGEPLDYWPRKGQYAVVDRAFAGRLRKIVFCTHSATTKGINVVPTTHGSALLGPTATDHDNPRDTSTDVATVEALIDSARRLVPALHRDMVIKTFAANRPASDEQFRLRFDLQVPNLLHCTDRSAGVSISPAAADMVLELLREAGLPADERNDATAVLPPNPRVRVSDEPETLIRTDPLYGQIVCACEHVSAAEINRALAGPVPATSMDGVRKRTGAAYGRCQGSLCSAGISFMTAQKTGTGPATVKQTTRGTIGR
ncbi:NAD(P)/FAD-dependent oxidoreductase [Mycolicibacterium tokaiense]|uniref:FAD dependent oxidoreductase n=1 Tax=Mycolicibacterium tokaiense TaxID=39695 RepID=A0A378TDJ1_9MYCO|nr:FAD-dependent oxidoreductase [Mycolicibacterium tokaiense]BBY86613.1 FAD/NAD(P)-binding oxidoreductase [Mycolicibacterium tokaiense]STZ58882.1 FAD dependent oxidoreductase [Mycolicibacterium tokaiense]